MCDRSRLAQSEHTISFYAPRFQKEISGTYSVRDGIITVCAADGRTKKTQVGGHANAAARLARIMLFEMESDASGGA
jgi:hypothetical protein